MEKHAPEEKPVFIIRGSDNGRVEKNLFSTVCQEMIRSAVEILDELLEKVNFY